MDAHNEDMVHTHAHDGYTMDANVCVVCGTHTARTFLGHAHILYAWPTPSEVCTKRQKARAPLLLMRASP
eukprot:1577727-Prymnesium_polylepis.2